MDCRGLPRLVFESETQRLQFEESAKEFKGRTTSLPVFFSDAGKIWQQDSTDKNPPARGIGSDVRLGLLGGVDPERRDYETLIGALEMLNHSQKVMMAVSVLGLTRHRTAEEIVTRLRGVAKVATFGEYISNRTLVSEFLECDVLISPLRTDIGYGARKGTGALGDALAANRMLLIPTGIELDEVIMPATLSYGSVEELYSHLVKLISKPRIMSIDAKNLSHYASATAINRSLVELGLSFSPLARGKDG